MTSWVIVEKSTDKAVCELYDWANVTKINREKYRIVPILKFLEDFNKNLNKGE
jgi:hypothetical protein